MVCICDGQTGTGSSVGGSIQRNAFTFFSYLVFLWEDSCVGLVLVAINRDLSGTFCNFSVTVFGFFTTVRYAFLACITGFFATFNSRGFVVPVTIVTLILLLFGGAEGCNITLIDTVIVNALMAGIVTGPTMLHVEPCGALRSISFC